MTNKYSKTIGAYLIVVTFLILAFGSEDSKSVSDSSSFESNSSNSKKTRTVYSGGYAVKIDLTPPAGYEIGGTCSSYGDGGCDDGGVTNYNGTDMICPSCNGKGFRWRKKSSNSYSENRNSIYDNTYSNTEETTTKSDYSSSNVYNGEDNQTMVSNQEQDSPEEINSSSSNNDSLNALELIANYYQDIMSSNFDANKWFDESVTQYILKKNINPDEINELNQKNKEFIRGVYVINKGTFKLNRIVDNISYWQFENNFSCYRTSKKKYQSCKILVEVGINQTNNKIISYVELKVSDLIFTERKPN